MNKTIVLLGASNDASGKLSQMAIDRLECAYSVYTSNNNVKIVCTGGFGEHFNTTNISHAEYLKQWLLLKGMSDEVFLPHIISSNTKEDLQGLKETIINHPTDLLIIITSDFHVKRVQILYEMLVNYQNVIFIPANSHLKKEELLARIAHEEIAIKNIK